MIISQFIILNLNLETTGIRQKTAPNKEKGDESDKIKSKKLKKKKKNKNHLQQQQHLNKANHSQQSNYHRINLNQYLMTQMKTMMVVYFHLN